ncbi:hypothetical protein TNCT_429041 [Trichonephila clavata]|uniref:Uncharacterized protein n=1 Tax=Trichonephila clavata TaxID=2740835 RepID=A0A8X6HRD1_TRICU|nr:hypothetical protein TNCT_429041 [Trichonephila clavata]
MLRIKTPRRASVQGGRKISTSERVDKESILYLFVPKEKVFVFIYSVRRIDAGRERGLQGDKHREDIVCSVAKWQLRTPSRNALYRTRGRARFLELLNRPFFIFPSEQMSLVDKTVRKDAENFSDFSLRNKEI